MTPREIGALFADLELRLIRSLKRNLRAHKSREKAEGGQGGVPKQWPAWQAEKLRSLNAFRRQNEQILGDYASRIDAETRAMLEEQFSEADGSKEAFFGVNADKVSALVAEITEKEQTAEKAALRYMEDVYRRTILRADAALTAGGVTMQQAVDLAVRDFLEQGITCIRYKNGRQVNIATYAEMALRTSNTRAMLLGEAQKRERLGIDTVLVSQYGGCSETCLPWQGLVYIDDVWQPYRGDSNAAMGGSYGISRNGRSYLLLSVAVRAGLFHPNCRHTVGTWQEGNSTRPKPMDKAKIEAAARLEAKQRRMEWKVRKDKRLVAGTQDPDRVKEYKADLRRDQKALRAFVAEHGDVLRRNPWRERNDLPGTAQPAAPSRTSRKPDTEPLQKLHYAEDVTEKQRTSIEKELSVLPKAQREAAERQISRIRVVDDPDKSGYDPRTKEILMSSRWRPGDVIHEYGHALERELDLWHNDRYRALRKEGLDLADLSQVVYDKSTFTGEIYYIRNRKFVSEYQGRIYPDRDGSILKAGVMEINDSLLLEYFSEGYRAYYMEPDLLKQRDADLFSYIGGLLRDES